MLFPEWPRVLPVRETRGGVLARRTLACRAQRSSDDLHAHERVHGEDSSGTGAPDAPLVADPIVGQAAELTIASVAKQS